jgi:hypothetical protein
MCEFIRAGGNLPAEICKLGGRGQVIVTDFDGLDLLSESFDAIYALESIATKDLTPGWRAAGGCLPGGSLIRSPGSLDHCRRKEDYMSVTALRQLAL